MRYYPLNLTGSTTEQRPRGRRRALRAGIAAGCAAMLLAPPSDAKPTAPAARSAAAAPKGAVPVLPAPTGPLSIGTASARLVDRSHRDALRPSRRYRELMVSIWYPRQGGDRLNVAPLMPAREAAGFARYTAADVGLSPSAVQWAAIKTHARTGAPVEPRPGGWPVVLYSPGLDGPRSLGTELVEELASRGYIVVTIDHTYQPDQVEFPGGRIERGRLPEPSSKAQFRHLLATITRARLQDYRFVLSTLKRQSPWPDGCPAILREQLDTEHIGAFGHSFGGAALTQFAHGNPEIKAVANLDGQLLGPVLRTGITQPYLLMSSGTAARSSVPGWSEFWAHTTGPKFQVRLPHAEHLSFMDLQSLLPQVPRRAFTIPRSALIGTINPATSVTAQRDFLSAFFDQQLRDQPAPLLNGTTSLPGAELVP